MKERIECMGTSWRPRWLAGLALSFAALALVVACPLGGNENEQVPEDRQSENLQWALEKIDAFTREEMDRWRIPGLAIGIVKDGEPVYVMGFGHRDPELVLEVTPATNFSLASMTKAFTALTCGLMVEDGFIDWDTPVRERVRDFTLSDPELAARVTLRDLLSHRTGLAEKASLWTSGEYRAEQIFERLKELEIAGPLGEHYEYSNVLYIAAAVMVEKLGGESWDVVARRRLLGPLDMTTSGFSVEELLRTSEYSVSFSEEKGAYVANDFPGPEHNAWYFPRGSGSMYSNVENMIKWMVFQLGDGRYDGSPIVKSETLRITHKAAIPLSDPPFYLGYPGIENHAYAMGWFVDNYRGHRRIHHGGASMGYSNYVTLFPDEQIGIVVLSNREVLFPVELIYYAGDLMLGLKVENWRERFSEYVPGN